MELELDAMELLPTEEKLTGCGDFFTNHCGGITCVDGFTCYDSTCLNVFTKEPIFPR